MAENVKVIVRCRPMNKKESDMKCKVYFRRGICATSPITKYNLNVALYISEYRTN